MLATGRVRAAYARIRELDRPDLWISLRPEAEVTADARAIDARVAAGEQLPLAGRLVAVKDNIDVAGLPTTAGCPAYAYLPRRHATAVARLLEAGAVVLGKTNLDQFATGLVGTRSPYGAVQDARRPGYVSGGSSSGSAVAVALGLADLGLATDTAGSGRVPAAFAGIVGVKPTRGLLPVTGVVPAAPSFDCVSTFAANLPLASLATRLMAGVDPADRGSRVRPADAPLAAPLRPRIAVPRAADLAPLTPDARRAFAAVVRGLAADVVETDLTPFLHAARLLYEGALIAERYAAVGAFLETADPRSLDPTVRQIIVGARDVPAHRLVTDRLALADLAEEARAGLVGADALLIPTTTAQPTLAQVAADPVAANSRLGVYTNFANLLDLCAVAVPAGRADGGQFGVTVLAPAFHDAVAADVAALVLDLPRESGPAPDGIALLVIGAHMSGLPLNRQLTDRGARYLRAVRTTAEYRLHRLPGEPARPGMVRVTEDGIAVAGELWALPPAGLGTFLADVPAPLSLGRVRLEDGTSELGFLCEAAACATAPDISAAGSWRAHLAAAHIPGV